METLREAITGITEKNGNYKIKVYYENEVAHDYIESDTIKEVIAKYGDRVVDSYDYTNGEYSFVI